MKSVYACSKPDGTLALAIDIIAIGDPKTIGAFLKLAGESGLLIDRVEPHTVIFEDRSMTRPAKDNGDKRQLEMDFSKPAAGEGKVGPAEMGEGFSCTYSGPCPHENKSCTSCEYAGSIFPPKAEAKAEDKPEEKPEQVAVEPAAEVPISETEVAPEMCNCGHEYRHHDTEGGGCSICECELYQSAQPEAELDSEAIQAEEEAGLAAVEEAKAAADAEAEAIAEADFAAEAEAAADEARAEAASTELGW